MRNAERVFGAALSTVMEPGEEMRAYMMPSDGRSDVVFIQVGDQEVEVFVTGRWRHAPLPPDAPRWVQVALFDARLRNEQSGRMPERDKPRRMAMG